MIRLIWDVIASIITSLWCTVTLLTYEPVGFKWYLKLQFKSTMFTEFGKSGQHENAQQ